MGDIMEFPDTVEEFMEEYKMVDKHEIYSNGTEYVPIFRMKQWFEHCKAQSANAKRYIDADALLEILPSIEDEYKFCRKIISEQPTADVVEVIPCEECKHRDEPSCQIKVSLYGLKGWDYCSYGERR